MRRSNAVLIALAAAAFNGRAANSSQGPSLPPPGADEVRSFLAEVAVAAASGDESKLRRFFEGGGSYPREDLAFIKSVEFWKLRPAFPVKRLGPDGFSINFVPEQPDATQGVATFRMRVTVPVRRGRDGQLRVLSRAETERLARLALPEPPEGEVVAFDHPDQGSLRRQPGRHYLTDLRATAQGDTVRLALRFDPPLTGPGLAADRPVKDDISLGDEIRVEISFDADASAATGFRMDEFYRRMREVEKGAHDRTQEIQVWQDFGVDKSLSLAGKKFVQSDGVRAWGLRAALSNVAPESAGAGMIRHHSEVVFEKTLADPEVQVDDDVLTLTVPAALLPMKAGASYRVMLQSNSGDGLLLKALKATVAGTSG